MRLISLSVKLANDSTKDVHWFHLHHIATLDSPTCFVIRLINHLFLWYHWHWRLRLHNRYRDICSRQFTLFNITDSDSSVCVSQHASSDNFLNRYKLTGYWEKFYHSYLCFTERQDTRTQKKNFLKMVKSSDLLKIFLVLQVVEFCCSLPLGDDANYDSVSGAILQNVSKD